MTVRNSMDVDVYDVSIHGWANNCSTCTTYSHIASRDIVEDWEFKFPVF
jgi:hypothetical protein